MKMRKTECVAYMEEMKNAYKLWSENVKGRDHVEDTGIDERIKLRWILKYGMLMWAGFIWHRTGMNGSVF